MDVRLQPVQRHEPVLVVRPDLRVARLRRRAQERRDDAVARVEVRLVEPQQDDHVHDPAGREVVGRQAAHGCRRPLHLPADQEAPGPRPPGRLVGAEERDPQGQHRSPSSSRPPAVPYFYYVGGQTPILPQHIWKSVKNPVTYKDTNPLGSGPFKFASCSPQVMKYTKNGHYWQKGKPKIDTVYYPAYTSNDPANQDLASGAAQWGSQYIPNIKAFYLVEEQGQPLLVPAGHERLDLHQPQEPDPQERRRPPRDGVRGQPGARVEDRRVRLRARRRTRPGSSRRRSRAG